MIDGKKLISYIKTKINPYGKPFSGTVYEFGNLIMDYIEKMDKQSTADIDKVLKQLYMIIEELGSELEHYELLEEQGRLIELPCAVGDTVYCLAQYAVKGELTGNFFVDEIQISSFEFDGQLYVYDLDGIDYSLDDIFLTKEEAQAKLKEMAGETE